MLLFLRILHKFLYFCNFIVNKYALFANKGSSRQTEAMLELITTPIGGGGLRKENNEYSKEIHRVT